MKRILILCSILISSLSSFSQRNLVPSTTTVTSGTVITLTATGENPGCYYEGVYWILQSVYNGGDVGLSLEQMPAIQYYSQNPYKPTKFNVRVYNQTSQPITQKFTIIMQGPCGIFNYETPADFTLTVNPGFYTNLPKCVSFTRNNCAVGYKGTTGTYCAYQTSTISQADADAKAQAEIDANTSQSIANQYLSCLYVYKNVALTTNYTRNNCVAGVGSIVPYSVPANKYSSTISQADANSKAQAEATTNGQNNANNIGTCTYFNELFSQNFTRNNCTNGLVGSVVAYVVPANKYSSTISLADALSKAQSEATANGQAYANNNGTCLAPRCFGNDKFINGKCETPRKIYTNSVDNTNWSANPVDPKGYTCTFHYYWSDGSISPDYTENSLTPCVLNPLL